MSDIKELISYFLENPDELGRRVGFKDLTSLHAEWIREMVKGTGDYT